MIESLALVGLLVATVVGALLQSILGWKDVAGDIPFDFGRYWPSLVRAAISAIVIFVGVYSGYVGEANLVTYLLAFLTGMGIDAAGNRLAGITGIGQKT